MSEDEAIEILKVAERTKCKGDTYTISELNAIETILDLYNQEKEKNKELENNYDKLTKHFIENSVSKDKIKAKIKEYEQFTERNKDGKYWTDEAILYDRQAEVLRELL